MLFDDVRWIIVFVVVSIVWGLRGRRSHLMTFKLVIERVQVVRGASPGNAKDLDQYPDKSPPLCSHLHSSQRPLHEVSGDSVLIGETDPPPAGCVHSDLLSPDCSTGTHCEGTGNGPGSVRSI